MQKILLMKTNLLVAGQLRRLQRVFKLAPTYEASNALLDKGIHSSAASLCNGQRQVYENPCAEAW